MHIVLIISTDYCFLSVLYEMNGEHFLEAEGGFPLSTSNFFCVRMHLKFTLVYKIEAMYGGSHINIKVEQKLLNCGNQP